MAIPDLTNMYNSAVSDTSRYNIIPFGDYVISGGEFLYILESSDLSQVHAYDYDAGEPSAHHKGLIAGPDSTIFFIRNKTIFWVDMSDIDNPVTLATHVSTSSWPSLHLYYFNNYLFTASSRIIRSFDISVPGAITFMDNIDFPSNSIRTPPAIRDSNSTMYMPVRSGTGIMYKIDLSNPAILTYTSQAALVSLNNSTGFTIDKSGDWGFCGSGYLFNASTPHDYGIYVYDLRSEASIISKYYPGNQVHSLLCYGIYLITAGDHETAGNMEVWDKSDPMNLVKVADGPVNTWSQNGTSMTQAMFNTDDVLFLSGLTNFSTTDGVYALGGLILPKVVPDPVNAGLSAFDIFQGDPKIFMGKNGSYLSFKGGQPVMDQGLENKAMIKLFTRQGWVGNVLVEKSIGSDFEKSFEQPITISSLNNIRNAALKALKDPAFGLVDVVVTNPESYRINVNITLHPPSQDIIEILLTKDGLNWIAQKLYPAYERG